MTCTCERLNVTCEKDLSEVGVSRKVYIYGDMVQGKAQGEEKVNIKGIINS